MIENYLFRFPVLLKLIFNTKSLKWQRVRKVDEDKDEDRSLPHSSLDLEEIRNVLLRNQTNRS